MEYHILKNIPDLYKNENKLYISSLDRKAGAKVKSEAAKATDVIKPSGMNSAAEAGKI